MHIKNIDLNLLVVADALFKHKNVSRAAHDLGLSQSALSHALGRLRTQFKDPFFVRTSKGVMPTEFARSIHPEIIEIIRRAQQLATHKTAFLPIHAKGRITLATSDYVESVVMPRLLPILHKEAPGLQISLRPTAGELPKKELEEGKIDLAIAGFYRQLPEGFYQSKLFTDEFRVASAKSSAQFGPQLSREDYYSARHALITLQGDFHDDLSQKIGKKRYERIIVYGSYSFTGIAWALQSSSMLLTAPSLLLKAYEPFFPLRTWDGPIDLGKIEIRMIWHAQTHDNDLQKWVREQIRLACAGL